MKNTLFDVQNKVDSQEQFLKLMDGQLSYLGDDIGQMVDHPEVAGFMIREEKMQERLAACHAALLHWKKEMERENRELQEEVKRLRDLCGQE
ncbi:hypothetical protein [Alkalicoccus urumqiensis]|uniref:Uncharacterized protein n=1 Tax=Alkalicoccus urumqiensis TaxID=1548213 RepID=A0A2P6ME70_ALKUR|nr:hypothetical protein [Alkalicoccus urumqiensis]PRO64570.1 hypothetical protein C6I21_13820 [Alkalicoccus urumqiensis]